MFTHQPWPINWTTNAFLERYPEFRQAGPMLARAIATATAQCDPNFYGTLTQEAIGLVAAIALAGSPFSQTQKQDPNDEAKVSEYKQRLAEIKMQKRVGFIVL